jgi:hypothetical protein
MRRITALLAIAASSLACIGDAQAQTYYVRQRLPSLKVVTPPPPPQPNYVYIGITYGPYGACVNNESAAEPTLCKRNDGLVVDNSKCKPSVVTCGTRCETMYPNQMAYGSGAVVGTGSASSVDGALSWCSTNKPFDFVGICLWDSRSGVVTISRTFLGYIDNPSLYATNCR